MLEGIFQRGRFLSRFPSAKTGCVFVFLRNSKCVAKVKDDAAYLNVFISEMVTHIFILIPTLETPRLGPFVLQNQVRPAQVQIIQLSVKADG